MTRPTRRPDLRRGTFLCLLVAASAAPLCGRAAMLEGLRGDGVADLYVGGGRDLILHTDGAILNGFLLTSTAGLLAGEAYFEPAGVFITDEDDLLADQFGYVLAGLHDLGRVVAEGVSFEQLSDDLTLTYTVQGLPGVHAATILPATAGDCDLDGGVGRADLQVLHGTYGMAAGAVWVDGDFTGDGAVDCRDYIELKRSYGQPVGGTVPEPATLALLAAAAACATGTRKRKRRLAP